MFSQPQRAGRDPFGFGSCSVLLPVSELRVSIVFLRFRRGFHPSSPWVQPEFFYGLLSSGVCSADTILQLQNSHFTLSGGSSPLQKCSVSFPDDSGVGASPPPPAPGRLLPDLCCLALTSLANKLVFFVFFLS